MTTIADGVSILSSSVLGLLPPVLFRQRLIGTFIPDVTIEEQSVDELEITDHPVEQGAAITDHAFKRPARVTMRTGWTNSRPGGNPIRVQTIYAGLLALQQTRIPFIVITGKRLYKNMLLERLLIVTDEKYENALSCVADCREILLATTQVLTVPDAGVMKSPETTAAVVNTGTKSAIPAPNFRETFGS